MRVLLVDDRNVEMEPRIDELRSAGVEVDYAQDPFVARRCLDVSLYDVVVVDLSFQTLWREYAQRVKDGDVSLTEDREFLVSGLRTLRETKQIGRRSQDDDKQRPGTVVFSTMEPNRQLHIFYAHEILGVRAYCSKDAPTIDRRGSGGSLLGAIRTAAQSDVYDYADAASKPCLPDKQCLRSTLFEQRAWYGIWRAFALGIVGDTHVKNALGLTKGKPRDRYQDMLRKIRTLNHMPDYIEKTTRTAQKEVYGYARENWLFFLDDEVMREFPPETSYWGRVRSDSH